MLLKTEGFVLRNKKYAETDSLLTIFTRKLGKINAIAKGVQRSKSTMMAAVQPFCYSDFVLYKGKSLYTVSQCEPKEIFYKIREDIKKLSYGAYVVELVDAVANEGQTNNRLFNLLGKTLYLLTKSEIEIDTIIRSYELHFLNYSGFKPEFDQCVNCGKKQSPHWRFSPQEGGILCNHCLQQDPYSMRISDMTLRLAKYLQSKDIIEVQKLKVNKSLNDALKKLLKQYIMVHINKYDFKSMELADKMSLNS